jgi:hypothetical protein
MKALTIKQPWAWAIIHAGKDIENRSWLTRYRGELAIHAGARMHDYTKMPRGVRAPEDDDLVFSAIIGIVEVVDSVEKSRSKWFMGPCGLVLRNARLLAKPVPCSGKLGLWNVPPEIERRVRRHPFTARLLEGSGAAINQQESLRKTVARGHGFQSRSRNAYPLGPRSSIQLSCPPCLTP